MDNTISKDLPSLETLNTYFQLDSSCPSGLRRKNLPDSYFSSPGMAGYINRRYGGQPAGGKTLNGYYSVKIESKSFFAHRVVYALSRETTLFNDLFIDHIDRNKQNNHPDNLRLATRSLNSINRFVRKPTKINPLNTSGVTNVYFHSGKQRWIYKYYVDGRMKTKSFTSFETARDYVCR